MRCRGGPHCVSCHTLVRLLSAGPVPVSRCSSAFCSSSCRRQGCGFALFPPAASLLLPETLSEFCFLFQPPPTTQRRGDATVALVMRQRPDLGLCREAAAGTGIATGVLLQFKTGRGRHFWRWAAAVLGCPRAPPAEQRLCPHGARPETSVRGHRRGVTPSRAHGVRIPAQATARPRCWRRSRCCRPRPPVGRQQNTVYGSAALAGAAGGTKHRWS